MKVGYIHFLDLYHYERARRSHHVGNIWTEAQRAFRLAAASFDRVYVPASSFFESDLAREILSVHPILSALGRITLIAGEPTLEDHREAKLLQYGPSSPLGLDIAYGSRAKTGARYKSRVGSSRLGIEYSWHRELEQDRVLRGVDPLERLDLPLALENAWARVPKELGEKAFIAEHAFGIAAAIIGQRPRDLKLYMERVIERAYMESYVKELAAGVVEDLVCLASPFPMVPSPDSIFFGKELLAVARHRLLPVIDGPEVDFIEGESRLKATFGDFRQSDPSPPSGHDQPRERSRIGGGHGRPQRRAASRSPGFAVLTALPYEAEAVRHLLHEAEDVPRRGPNIYTLGWLPSVGAGRDIEVVLTQCITMANKSATASVTRLGYEFESVTDVVVCGIAGAVPRPGIASKDVMLGDVVISERDGVIDLGHIKRYPDRVELRGKLPPPSPRVLAAADRLVGSQDFDDAVAARISELVSVDQKFTRPPPDTDVLYDYDGRPIRAGGRLEMKIFRGVIGSGDVLVLDPLYRDKVRDAHPSVLALEMESAGVAHGCYEGSQHYFVVRCLVDYCSPEKNDLWHHYASAAAASVATTFISSFSKPEAI